MMESMRKQAAKLLPEDSGQGATEYALVVGFIALVTIIAGTALTSGMTSAITSTIAAAWPS